MTAARAAGPSGAAAWQVLHLAAGGAVPLAVMLLPDAAAEVHHALLAAPVVCGRNRGAPVFSLTLVLDREPLPTENSIGPLVMSGALSLEVSYAVPAAVLQAAAANTGAEVRPLFVRNATVAIASDGPGERTVAQASCTGTRVKVALSATLTRDEALDVLHALDGRASALAVRARVAFRTGASSARARVSASWTRIYDFLALRVDERGEIDRAALRRAFEDMTSAGVLRVEILGAGGTQAAPPPELFDAWMRLIGVVAERRDEERFRLRTRPVEGYELDYTQDIAAAGSERTVDVDARLEQLLGGLLEGLPRDAYIHLVCMTANSDGTLAQPRRIPATPRARDGATRLRLSAMDASVQSIARTLRPAAGVHNAAVLANSDIAALHPSPALDGRLTHHWVDDAVLDTLRPQQARQLPIVTDPGAPLWADRVRPNVYWYAPEFTLVKPSPTDAPAGAAYLFSYRRTGATADGKPALAGTVRFTLRVGRSVASDAALKRIPNAQAVALPLNGLAVSLSVPYVDDRSGATALSTYHADITQNGDTITATVRLLNDAVRLAYGALAVPGFQSQPARLQIAYSYEGYVALSSLNVAVVAGGKAALTPVAHTAAESRAFGAQPHLDLAGARFRYPSAEVRLLREAARAAHVEPPESESMRAGAVALAGSVLAVHPVATAQPAHAAATSPLVGSPAATHAAAVSAVTLAHPHISPVASLAEILKTRYAARTFVREERADASFPCEQLGTFYRRESDGGDEAAGCVDALKLGEAAVRQYGEIAELADPAYRVFRSLQQPGRFLVLPAAYRITRYEPEIADKAYRPVIAVYSAIDVDTPENNRVVYQATLQADIPPYASRRLSAVLAAQAAAPVIEYPTEIEARFEYAWTVGSMIRVEPGTVKTPDGFQVALATDLAGALMLGTMIRNTGVLGSARLQLPDGSTLDTTLCVDLGNIVGPWRAGPLAVARGSGGVALANRIERTVEVSDVLVFRNSQLPDAVKVEAALAPGASTDVAIGGSYVEALPVYAIPPGTPAALEEIRSFVEDIHTNVVFIDLVNHANHDLESLEVEAQIAGVAGTRAELLAGDPGHAEMAFLLPLTQYLASRVLRFRVNRIFRNAKPAWTAWLQWNLESDGNVISLTWDLIKDPPPVAN